MSETRTRKYVSLDEVVNIIEFFKGGIGKMCSLKQNRVLDKDGFIYLMDKLEDKIAKECSSIEVDDYETSL